MRLPSLFKRCRSTHSSKAVDEHHQLHDLSLQSILVSLLLTSILFLSLSFVLFSPAFIESTCLSQRPVQMPHPVTHETIVQVTRSSIVLSSSSRAYHSGKEASSEDRRQTSATSRSAAKETVSQRPRRSIDSNANEKKHLPTCIDDHHCRIDTQIVALAHRDTCVCVCLYIHKDMS